jgi:hypothetical protein
VFAAKRDTYSAAPRAGAHSDAFTGDATRNGAGVLRVRAGSNQLVNSAAGQTRARRLATTCRNPRRGVFQELERAICCSPVVCRERGGYFGRAPVSQCVARAGGLRFERDLAFVLDHAAHCKDSVTKSSETLAHGDARSTHRLSAVVEEAVVVVAAAGYADSGSLILSNPVGGWRGLVAYCSGRSGRAAILENYMRR